MDQLNNYFDTAQLVLKHLKGELTPSEKVELERWLAQDEENRIYFNKVTDTKFIDTELPKFGVKNHAIAWEAIRAKTGYNEPSEKMPVYKHLLKYAAVIAFLIIAAVVTFQYVKRPVSPQSAELLNKEEVAPGGNKATLTLADGTTILLDDAATGPLAKQQNTIINKTNDGQLLYSVTGSAALIDEAIAINKVSTPIGGKYQLILPDGTKVWLNSMSAISFPAVFAENKRHVKLTGEAYFEVVKDKTKPFIVDVDGMNVEVKGTQFNVMAYGNEEGVKTTLVEGSVKITNGLHEEMLIPGEQSVVKESGKIVVSRPDIEEAIAWKNGYFKFNKKDIKTIMRQLSRWYNIDVVYKANVPSDEFVGKISMNVNLSDVLRILDQSNVKYKMNGHQIIIGH